MSFDIEKGKKRFLALLNEISSERKGIEPLVAWLENGDFFSAPLTANHAALTKADYWTLSKRLHGVHDAVCAGQ